MQRNALYAALCLLLVCAQLRRALQGGGDGGPHPEVLSQERHPLLAGLLRSGTQHSGPASAPSRPETPQPPPPQPAGGARPGGRETAAAAGAGAPPSAGAPPPSCSAELGEGIWGPMSAQVEATGQRFALGGMEGFLAACAMEHEQWKGRHAAGAAAAQLQPLRPALGGDERVQVCAETAHDWKVLQHADKAVMRLAADPAAAGAARKVWVDAGANHFVQRQKPGGAVYRVGSTVAFVCGYPRGTEFELFAFDPALQQFNGVGSERDRGCLVSNHTLRCLTAGVRCKRNEAPLPGLEKACYVPWHPSVAIEEAGIAAPGAGPLWFLPDRSRSLQSGRFVSEQGREKLKGTKKYLRLRQVPLIDLAAWLLNHTSDADFVVLKLDVEGAEHALVPHLLRTGAARRVDELFFECHKGKKDPVLPRPTVGQKPRYPSCAKLVQALRAEGVLVHDWR
eukprot:TRINITY_DN31983_c0_g1_i1.p1 TRINITY_DN31983_c0_g1~~TRINITY_DN31983_c0_g1_i1.p1  ORF type:complete len:478 (+),score=134.74 TRINITY_DN31983_c0_g1_i1:80-1435(+)